MLKEILEFDEGLTVKELKEIIKDWPEERSDGTPTEVWISNADGVSNIAIELSDLNLDDDNVGDLILSHG